MIGIRERSVVGRDYRLLTTVILGFLGLGLLILAGCVGPYLLWGPQLREARLRGWRLVVRNRVVYVEPTQQEPDEVVHEVNPLADK